MTSNGGRSGVDKRRLCTTAKAFDHEGCGEGINIGEAGNIGGDVVGDRDAPGVVDAFVLLPRARRADGEHVLAERAGGDAGADAVDDADAFKAGDEWECGAGCVRAGDRHRVGGVEGTDQHAHHHFPGTRFPGFRDVTDHNSVDGAGRFSDGSKHAFSLVQMERSNSVTSSLKLT